MKTEYIPIDEHQHLSDVLPLIPSNTILYKTITGCGATHAEIRAKRNSIIIEPNVPVIIGKCIKHKADNLFGVYEGVYTSDILNYLIRLKQGEYIKIMTTPESFQKVKDAMEEAEVNIYYNCFMLFDECHRIIKDIDYREDITLPFDDFFLFQDKALVSATPIEFSDPRFEEQGFRIIRINPVYDVVRDITLCPTNNVLETLKRLLFQLEISRHPVCMFVNSSDIIYAIINQLNIQEDAVVFCAPKSVARLKEKGFQTAYTDFKAERMKKYNFFTSRFYCALDMDVEEQPDLVMLTDVYTAEYTMIDPYTDAIQIIGRFRNGVHAVYHISNTSNRLSINNKEELKQQVHTMESIYTAFQNCYNYACDRVSREVFHDTLSNLPYNRFLDKSGRKDFNRIDNYIDERLTQSYYYSKDTFITAYSNPALFNVQVASNCYYPLGDYERLKRENKSLSIKARRKILVAQLEMLGDCETELEREQKNELRFADALTVDAYELLGKEELERLDYSPCKIREAMILKRYEEGVRSTEFQLLIKNSFIEKQRYSAKFIKSEITRIYDLLNIYPRKTITSNLIQDFFEVKECLTGKKEKRERGFLIVRAKI